MGYTFLCPYLRQSSSGAACDAAVSVVKNNLIEDIEDADIKMCTSRHFESCYLYFVILKRKANTCKPQIMPSDMLMDCRSRNAGGL